VPARLSALHVVVVSCRVVAVSVVGREQFRFLCFFFSGLSQKRDVFSPSHSAGSRPAFSLVCCFHGDDFSFR